MHKDTAWHMSAGHEAPVLSMEETLWQAMALGLHDYVGKNNFPGVVIGLSGGIDSGADCGAGGRCVGGGCGEGGFAAFALYVAGKY